MSPLDPATLGMDTPRTADGREYPAHLRQYHALDDVLMPLVAELAPVTFDELSARLGDAKVRAALPRWIASAEWRGLIVRNAGTPRAYSLGPAVSWLETAA